MRISAHDAAAEAAKAAPAAFGAVVASLTLSEWVAVVTMLYIGVQCVYLLRKWYREERTFEERHEQRTDES